METTKSRHAFIRKVLLTIMVQIILTGIIVLPFLYVEAVNDFATDPSNGWIRWVLVGLSFIVLIMLSCYEAVRRSFPLNVIMLLIFTIVEGVTIGFVCANSDPQHILLAFAATVIVVFVLVLFACQVKYDFTSWLVYFVVTAVIIMLVSFLIALFYRDKIAILVIAAIGLLIFSIYLILNVQMIIGGGRYEYEEEDWIEAAIGVYIAIKSIFMYILLILGLVDS